MTGSSLLNRLAAWCTEAAAADSLPAVTRAKESVLDLVALALGGTLTEVGRIALRSKSGPAFPELPALEGFSVLGTSMRRSPGDAAGLNGAGWLGFSGAFGAAALFTALTGIVLGAFGQKTRNRNLDDIGAPDPAAAR